MKTQNIQEHNTQVNYLDTLLACWVAPDAKLSWLLLKKKCFIYSMLCLFEKLTYLQTVVLKFRENFWQGKGKQSCPCA
jgi:hypothetical protein